MTHISATTKPRSKAPGQILVAKKIKKSQGRAIQYEFAEVRPLL
jgi:hypothetical protein